MLCSERVILTVTSLDSGMKVNKSLKYELDAAQGLAFLLFATLRFSSNRRRINFVYTMHHGAKVERLKSCFLFWNIVVAIYSINKEVFAIVLSYLCGAVQ